MGIATSSERRIVAIVFGGSNAGKKSFIQRLGGHFSGTNGWSFDSPNLSIQSIYAEEEYPVENFKLVSSIFQAEKNFVFILVVDSTLIESYTGKNCKLIKSIITLPKFKDIVLLVFANKQDLPGAASIDGDETLAKIFFN